MRLMALMAVSRIKEELKLNYLASFVKMTGAVFVIFKEW